MKIIHLLIIYVKLTNICYTPRKKRDKPKEKKFVSILITNIFTITDEVEDC